MSTDKPTFVKIGDERIKLSNIKSYGISSETQYLQKVYEKDNDSTLWGMLREPSWVYKGKTIEIDKMTASIIMGETYSAYGVPRKLFSPESGYFDDFKSSSYGGYLTLTETIRKRLKAI